MSKNDDKTKKLIAKVEEQKAGLGARPRVTWLTTGVFKYPDGSHFNLNTVRDPQVLVEALAIILASNASTKEAAERLGVPNAKASSWLGYSASDWEKDFKLRIEVIRWEERKALLEQSQGKLKTLLSDDAKTEDALADIEALLA